MLSKKKSIKKGEKKHNGPKPIGPGGCDSVIYTVVYGIVGNTMELVK